MISPTYNKIVIKLDKDDAVEKTKTGLYLPQTAEKSRTRNATVVAVGPGRYENGIKIKCCVNVGDRVMVGRFITGLPLDSDDGSELLVVPDQEVIGLLNEKTLITEPAPEDLTHQVLIEEDGEI